MRALASFYNREIEYAQVKPWRKKSFNSYRECMIMYGITQVRRVHSRLTTGLGGLKPIWILVPVAVRFPGCYRVVSEQLGSHGRT